MTIPSDVPSQIEGYAVLPITLPPLPSFPVEATHYLYIAPHQPKTPTPTASRSLFLVNIPFDTTEPHLKALFSTQLGLPAGRVEKVDFEGEKRKALAFDSPHAANAGKGKKKRKRSSEQIFQQRLEVSPLPSTWDRDLHLSGSTAIVLFVDRMSTEAALKAVKSAFKKPKHPKWGEDVAQTLPQLGYQRYLKHQELTYPDKIVLLESVNSYMTAFAAKEAEQAKLRERQRQEPDEEGFVTVTRGGRTNPATQEAAQTLAEKHKEKRKGLDNFYRFQTRERKKAQANELKVKFEEDKERIRMLKEKKRSFMPE